MKENILLKIKQNTKDIIEHLKSARDSLEITQDSYEELNKILGNISKILEKGEKNG